MLKVKKTRNRKFCIGILLMISFAVWTAAVRLIDVQAIGPQNSRVGFATLNGFVHELIGVNMKLYTVTDWLGLIPVFVCMSFGILGFCQMIKRKSLMKVDFSLIALGVFYIAVAAVYVLFEELVINYRPVLIEGVPEASYPSSTTTLVMCVMPTAVMQVNSRIKSSFFRRITTCICAAFVVFMVAGRVISGVHWITDIIGGILLSGGLVMMYGSVAESRLKRNI